MDSAVSNLCVSLVSSDLSQRRGDAKLRETRPPLPTYAVTTRGMLIGRPIAILYFLARKITAEDAEERKSS